MDGLEMLVCTVCEAALTVLLLGKGLKLMLAILCALVCRSLCICHAHACMIYVRHALDCGAPRGSYTCQV